MPTPEDLAAAAAKAVAPIKQRVRGDTVTLALVGLIGSVVVGNNTVTTNKAIENVAVELKAQREESKSFREDVSKKLEATNNTITEVRVALSAFEKAKIEERIRALEEDRAGARVRVEELSTQLKEALERLKVTEREGRQR